MNTPEPKKTWQERFDEEVPFITEDAFICANCGSTFVRDGYNKENKFDLMCKNCNESAVMTPILFAKKECKSFIQELIKEEKLKVLEEIENILFQEPKGLNELNVSYSSYIQSLREKIEKGEL